MKLHSKGRQGYRISTLYYCYFTMVKFNQPGAISVHFKHLDEARNATMDFKRDVLCW